MESLQVYEDSQKKLEKRERSDDVIKEFIASHPEFNRQGALRQIVGFIGEREMTVDLMERAAGILVEEQRIRPLTDEQIEIQKQESEEEIKAELIIEREALAEELTEHISPDPRTREIEKKKLLSPFVKIEELRSRANRLREVRRLKALPVKDVRQIVRDGKPEFSYPKLNGLYQNRDILLDLANTARGREELRGLIRRFGKVQIDSILRAK